MQGDQVAWNKRCFRDGMGIIVLPGARLSNQLLSTNDLPTLATVLY